jgi:hypothetical protein
VSAQQAALQEALQSSAASLLQPTVVTTPEGEVVTPTTGIPTVTPGFIPPFFNNTPVAPAAQPVDSGGYGSSVSGQPQTPDGAALQGLAQVTSATAQANLADSNAALNATQAQKNDLRDRVQTAEAFYQARAIGRAGRDKDLGPAHTPEELANRAHAAAQPGLNVNQMDPVTGALHWPGPLQSADFDAQRNTIDGLTSRWIQAGDLDFTDKTSMRNSIVAMLDLLKSQIGQLPPRDYVAARSFLQSLLYATTRSVI